jgi:hypothetical protein
MGWPTRWQDAGEIVVLPFGKLERKSGDRCTS